MVQQLTTADCIALVGSIATAVAAVAALVALIYARGQIKEAQKQLRHSRAIAHGDFLLRLDEAFQRHATVHMLLQPDFAWGSNKAGPVSPEDWFLVTSYMGLFERVNFLIESEIEELAIIDKLYGYRVYNIVANNVIRVAKLENKEIARYWEGFIHLWLQLKSLRPDWNDYPEIKRSRS
jgi:hypothetical protein